MAEHVHTARRIDFGETDQAGEAWAGEVLHTVRHDGYDLFWEKLVAKRAQMRRPSKRAALDALMNYVSAWRGTMDYPRHENLGLPNGSGPQRRGAGAGSDESKQLVGSVLGGGVGQLTFL
jgi:hypothetical protein